MENVQISLQRFQAVLEPRVRTFQVIFGALLAGATLFLAVILLMYSNSTPKPLVDSRTNSILPILSVVHASEAIVCYIAAFFVYRFFAGPRGLEFLQRNAKEPAEMQSDASPELHYSGAIFAASIIRAALLEGVAIFGMIICLMGVSSGEIHNQPIYWLNLSSYVIFAAVMVATFPTKHRLENLFKEKFNLI